MADAPTFRAEQTGDPQIDRIQRVVADLIAVLKATPFLFGGRLVSVKFAAATPKTVRHNLGVTAACFVVRQNYDPAHSGPRMTEGDQTGVDPRVALVITTDVACDLDLWFYPQASKPIDAGQGQSL